MRSIGVIDEMVVKRLISFWIRMREDGVGAKSILSVFRGVELYLFWLCK